MKKLIIVLFLATLGMNAQDRKFEEIKDWQDLFFDSEMFDLRSLPLIGITVQSF